MSDFQHTAKVIFIILPVAISFSSETFLGVLIFLFGIAKLLCLYSGHPVRAPWPNAP